MNPRSRLAQVLEGEIAAIKARDAALAASAGAGRAHAHAGMEAPPQPGLQVKLEHLLEGAERPRAPEPTASPREQWRAPLPSDYYVTGSPL